MSTTPTGGSPANSRQVGGSHYKGRAIEHWDFIISWGNPYLEGNITKYVSRWRNKKGLEDIAKAGHYLDKLIEVSGQMAVLYANDGFAEGYGHAFPFARIPATDFCDAQGLGLGSCERAVIVNVIRWMHTTSDAYLLKARIAMADLAAQAKSEVEAEKCGVCGEPKWLSPSGPVCKNGHGG